MVEEGWTICGLGAPNRQKKVAALVDKETLLNWRGKRHCLLELCATKEFVARFHLQLRLFGFVSPPVVSRQLIISFPAGFASEAAHMLAPARD
jgi:hypothetical protein